ncbi:hypothetical protein ASPZODRAFT_57654 [Penicilliopsis zonata CBS 506.65]|uniref:Cysteine-rich transmembrane CYSTM domain-containing protein n=1 Tax=Penicilliopsis zonata CBS 506.65 TaxID=1073090 RepID=A0A1L9STD9_9EURO|nr:hypothetical protein ASPZODRAFT_57654 [Penicilliopsis zonata CBS 506.65]OJJ50384.1 hypothetical protein ASPZODRAFT_57654 [Penicilliopsis zonata CBS 506.65]
MFGDFIAKWLRQEEPVAEQKWDAQTITMQQPASPAGLVTEQPQANESMNVHLRGGDGEDICCGLCAGFCCFECCDCCCGDDGPGGFGGPGGPPGGPGGFMGGPPGPPGP